MTQNAGAADIFLKLSSLETFMIMSLNSVMRAMRIQSKGFNILIALLFFSLRPVTCQVENSVVPKDKTDTLRRKISLFASDDLMEISMRFDLTGFLRKTNKPEPFDGIMTFHLGNKDSVNRRINVKHGGLFRLQNCSFPPIRINFKQGVYAFSDTDRIKKIKLVTHCESGNKNDEYVLREYLVYKLYNILTDTSFRVRLLRITYIDTKKSRKPIRQYGILIEPPEIMAGRTKTAIVRSKNLTQKLIVPDNMDRLAIFNYMIANWDWSVAGQHNVALIKPLGYDITGLGFAVPFDFDLCGLVNADYAIPSAEIGLQTARDRKFDCLCRPKEIFKEDLLKFLNKKEKLYSVINDFPYLNQKAKKDITDFLDQFFGQLGKQKNLDYLIDVFLKVCKGL